MLMEQTDCRTVPNEVVPSCNQKLKVTWEKTEMPLVGIKYFLVLVSINQFYSSLLLTSSHQL